MLTFQPKPEGTALPAEALLSSDTPRAPSTPVDERRDRIFLIGLFCVALAANFFLVTRNWHSGFLIGHEFRQTQTAIISYYIDKQNNFTPRYDTPILGKPWEVPLEFPLYEWFVVWVSRAMQWPLFEAARAVGVASLYLTLPAVYLLLGQAGLARARRLIALALLLATPVYIFYSRAFLMDVTAMMFSAWFLAAFVQTMRTRQLRWWLIASVAGTAAGLIKSLTFFVWLLPAALYGAWCLWRAIREKKGGAGIAKTIGWGVGAVIIPALAVNWWIHFTDAIKEGHASAYIFTSKGLTHGNFGMYQLSARFQKETWRALLNCWSETLAHPWIIALIIVGGAWSFRAERWRILGAFGLFLAAQLLFPYAYAYQDYYFAACMVFAVCALGFALNGLFGSSFPRWIRWPAVLLPFAALYIAYAGYYYPQQRVVSAGGTGLTLALRDFLPESSVIVVAGSDWAAIIPYYSKHRALMIRNGLEHDDPYLERAFSELAEEDVSALVLIGDERGNQQLRKRASAAFNLDSLPTFSYHASADVYVSNFYRDMVLSRLQVKPLPEGIGSGVEYKPDSAKLRDPIAITRARSSTMFKMISPLPTKYRFMYRYEIWQADGRDVLNMHPDSDVWVPPPGNAKEIVWQFGILPGAYQANDKTSGAEFVIDAESEDGRARQLFVRMLNPATNAADRGTQTEKIPIQLEPGETLVFRTRPYGAYAYDWCYCAKIDVH